MSPPRLPFLLTALASAILSATAQADDPADLTELPAVTVTAQQEDADTSYAVPTTAAATKLTLSPRETPQSVTVITRQRMDDQAMQSLRDVLDNTTGIYSFGYDTERTVFMARGFQVDNTLIDGVPSLTRSNDDDATDSSLDTALYERIEVVRGTTGLLSGAGNPSAAINLVRKHADSKEATGSIDASAGSWNTYRTTFDVQSPLTSSGNVRGRLVGVLQDNRSYMDYYKSSKQVLYGTLDFDLTPDTLLTLGIDYQRTRPKGITWGWFPLFLDNGTTGGVLANWPRSVSTAPKWSFWNNTTATAFAELKHKLGHDWTLNTTVQHRDSTGDAALFYVGGFPDINTGTGLSPSVYRIRDKNQQNALDVYATGPFRLLGRQHELVAGLSGSQTIASTNWYPEDSSTVMPVGNFFNWDGNYPMPVFGAPQNIKQTQTRQSGLYSALRLSLADPLKLIVGGRYSIWQRNAYDMYADVQNAKYHKQAITPYGGLIYDLMPNVSLFTSYTGIFSPQDYLSPTGAYLDPMTGHSVEAGIKGSHLNGRLNTALTVFQTHQNHMAVPLPGVFAPDGVTQAYAGVDGAVSRGFELEVNGKITPDWNLTLGWSRSHTKDASGNDLLTYIPQDLVRLFTTYQLHGAWSKLTVGGGANWQSRSNLPTTCPDPLDSDGSGNYTATCNLKQKAVINLSAMARYQFTPKLSAQLNASNLLNTNYYVMGEYDSVNYAPPRSVMLDLKYQF